MKKVNKIVLKFHEYFIVKNNILRAITIHSNNKRNENKSK